MEPYTVALYPFVEGANGYRAELSQGQWQEFGATLRRIHDAPLPAALRRSLPVENWSPRFRAQVRAFQTRLGACDQDDPLAAELAALMQAEAAVIDALVEGAERLGQALQGRTQELVLCHADIHAGNLLITPSGALYVVDWDTALLAPKERDLMFPGSGLGPGWDRAETTAWFLQGYGETEVDRAALAYYRCERLVQDIAEFCEQILSTAVGEDRRQSLRFLASCFRPGGIADIALASYREAMSP
jgi:spectinomycin phosphotransferase